MSAQREAFEKWWSGKMNLQEMDLHHCEFPMTDPEDQPYACHETQRSWLAWQVSREQALEEAAQICDDVCKRYAGCEDSEVCAEEIRRLKARR